ncbi:BRCA2-interacting transcriptional repressor EMSY isoform X1 [Vanessa cardui]|uniref:BRCA2-interacting transcriptional repressor EMSY isoform X1 n=1 Tax=Vanessa cardui TaxID=171605 RepID=UPI001F148E00|nr:BRCA2-interacting transcriptional repressor EMSY isoform X1 [Vanessa cardui]
MWPMLLNMTRDECRRTLRRLELEAYSNMISVFRAQGALEDNRKKLLEELRAVLHISNDRHSAEARRVSNDELLATIAEQLAGPNTGLGWITEGRRLIPLMPRGIAQTMYTEIADKAAEAAAAENREIKNRIETEKLIAPKSNEEEMPDHEGQTAEGSQSNEMMDEMSYPPIAMEDNTAKIWETELICRKRKMAEGGTLPDDSSTPVKNMRNVPLNTNQKHLNLSQVYSRYSQPATSKSSGHSKHSYNQVSKVSTSKSSQPHAPRSIKHRSHKQSSKSTTQATLKAQRKTQEQSMSPSRQYNSGQQADFSGPPGSFQASYAQSILGSKTKTDYLDEIKPKVLSSPSMVSDSPTMQLLTQPATVPHELAVSDSAHPDDPSSLQAQATPVTKHSVSGKPCQLIIKKRGEVATDKKVQMSEFKVIQKPTDEVKFLSNRQMVVSPSPAHKSFNASNKIVTTKVIGSLPKSRTSHTPVLQSDKMIVVSKSSIENRLTNSKVIINSSGNATPTKDSVHSIANSIANKTTETLTPKGIPATDLKVSAKTFVVNPKSGQKMVVLPAKACKEGQLPLFHFKGIPTNMKLVSVSSHNAQATKSPAVNVLSNPTVVSAIPSSAKIVGVEPIKTANMADIVPVKGLTPPISTSKITNPIIRPMNTKGNIIVVQKGATLGKTLTFTKNGNDVSKIIMGKNVNKLLQTTKSDQVDPSKSGNVIVLELNNEQTGRTTTMSEILCSRNSNASCTPEKDPTNIDQEITQETPVLFENQITPEICNTSSLDSSTSLQEIDRLDQSTVGIIEKSEKEKTDFIKDTEGVKDTSSVTDWEMELDTTPGKSKDDVDKLNSLHLDLGMSSDSENEYMVDGHEAKTQHLAAERMQTETPTGDNIERYSNSSALSRTTRTLLSQLQDDGSSSNDSSFAIKSKCLSKIPDIDIKIDKSESEALSKARAKLSEKVAEAKSQQRRIDIYSTAITTSEINLDSFSYLDESLMAGDDEFPSEGKREARQGDVLDDQLSRLLGEDSANSTDSQTVSESLPIDKNEQ